MKSLGLINLFIFCASILFAQHPVNLRCEYLKNPLGIDVESPRFTWQIADNRMGARQETYQVILGTDSLAVLQGKGTLWNSGKIASKACLVPYRGRVPLLPFQKYYWRVETTDAFAENHVSAVSCFETGMRGLSHWKGAWISDGQDTGGRTKEDKPAPYFRKEFTVKKQILSARAYIAVGGLYELFVNGQRIGNHRLDPMFTRSNPLLNKIWKATNTSYLSNLFGYPTDCPQREKNGWTGDAHIAIETGLYNFDGITIYEKWMADHRDEQQANGTLPAIIPSSGWGYSWGNGLDWTSTIASQKTYPSWGYWMTKGASATHQSPYGEIVSKWKRTGKKVIYTIVIPANTTATLSVPKGYHLKKMSEANPYDLLAGKYQCEFVK